MLAICQHTEFSCKAGTLGRPVRAYGRMVRGGIHRSDLPSMFLWGERELVPVANLTRHDAEEFFPIAVHARVRTHRKT
ncbi:hypothetical protein JMG10_48175 [Nostoc ellipsosporum NOK]|nr:hypothetical protein [Nostoc ellipsosporum NOK]